MSSSNDTYAVARLDWEEVERYREYRAQTIFCTVLVWRNHEGGGWWSTSVDGKKYRSREAAQDAVFDWNLSQLLPALTKIETTP